MKIIYHLLSLLFFVHILSAKSYLDSLDTIIDEKITILSQYHTPDIKNIVKQTQLYRDHTMTPQSITNFLDPQHSLISLLEQHCHSENYQSFDDSMLAAQKALNELSIAIEPQLYLCYVQCAQKNMVHKALLVYEAIRYWENEKFYEHVPFYQKNMFRWNSGQNYHHIIIDTIASLKIIAKKIYGFLGLLRYNENLVMQAENPAEFLEHSKIAAQLQHEFLYNNHTSHRYQQSTINSIIKNSLVQYDAWNKDIDLDFMHCHVPSHVERHWHAYATLAAILAASGIVYSKYGNDIIQGTQFFWQENVKTPLERLIKESTGFVQGLQFNTRPYERTIELMVQRELEKDQPVTDGHFVYSATQDIGLGIYDSLKNSLPTHLFGWTGNQPGQEPVAAQGHADANINITQEQLRDALERSSKILAHPGKNYSRVFPASMLTTHVLVLDILTKANIALKDAHTVLNIAALLPLLTIMSGSIFASKKLYTSLLHEPMKELMRHIDTLLNMSLYEPVSFEKEGTLYFLTEQLTLHVPVLTITEQKLMYADIDELQSVSLDYRQKFHVVERMYRTYHCLQVLANL